MQKDIQRVLDHIGLGKIISIEPDGSFYVVLTTQGKFIVHEADPVEARLMQSETEAFLRDRYGEVTRILMPDYTGGLNEDASYIHQNDKYYSIYMYS